MAVTASVSELQGLAEQKLTELSAQIDQRTAEVRALETTKRTLEEAIHQLETRKGVVQQDVADLSAQVERSSQALTDAQQQQLARLTQAEDEATAAQAKAEQAQAVADHRLREIHAQRERVRAVLVDALDEAQAAIKSRTEAHQAYTTKLDGLLALVTKATAPDA